ncbi:MAG: DNA replication protein [Hyphomicrobiales bacterium]|nr:DNA replication protein [Hyphomicrobiales bacterium]MDE2114583.1 DNA replication protein [Hyphomicrobiales bacterium]
MDAAGHGYLARLDAGAGEDAFRAQHLPLVRRVLAFEPGAGAVQINAAESPLAWLARRKDRDGNAFISAVQLASGERLRAELTRACLLPQVTARWGGVTGGSGGAVPFAENVAAARQRVRAALRACGPEMAGLLMDVCGFLKGLEQIEQERGWARRSAKFVLSSALDQLCRHYGMEASATGRASHSKIRNWGTPDYRPRL